jgi:tetratricopeptide (TPR) repeat protein
MTPRVAARLAVLALALTAAPGACAQDARSASEAPRTAGEALRSGRYDGALEQARRDAARDTASAEHVRIAAAALLATGRYAEAEQELTAFIAAHPRNPELLNALGEAQRERGRLAEAETSFRRAVDGRAHDSLTAVVNLAVLRFDRGDVDAAMREFDRFIDIYNDRRGRLTASELAAVAVACRYLGRENPQLFKDALRAWDEAIAADTLDLDRRVRLAELFLEKYNGADAQTTLTQVLDVNPRHARALLVMAQARQFADAPDAPQYLKQSLAVNPHAPEARAFSALLLLDLEQYAEAIEEARRGLTADSTSPPALSALAAAQYLRNDTVAFRATLARVHSRQPRSADAEVTLANVAARSRLYAEAVTFADAGATRDPRSARALAMAGINTMRTGDIQRGRELLERAFALDPYDVWAKNTLDLLDTFKDYTEVKTPRFTIMIETKDAPLLALYAEPLAEQAYDSLAARYGYRPPTPLRLEIYRSHEDFSVRTVGLAGLGALGVSFGQVVAMDSPAARNVGDFNWGSTLWHEMAHVFTLGASGNRVPRWVSEGLSVYEERRARESWGEDPTPLFLAAYASDRLPKVSRLNDGFMRPTFPAQIILSYYLASLVVEMIEQEHGITAIRGMLDAYRRGRTTEQVMRDVLRTEPGDFDDKFDRWVRKRFAQQLAAVKSTVMPRPAGPGRGEGAEGGITVTGEFLEQLENGKKLLDEGKVDDAIALLQRAKQMFPEYAHDDSPYALLARAYAQKGDRAAAARELSALTAINEQAYTTNVTLATALMDLRDTKGAAAALERALWIYPFEASVHEKLAMLSALLADRPTAIRERRALVALDPTDRAEALYQLALAYSEAGDVTAARREVLRALELAPSFEKAQELLLRLREVRPPGGAR